MTTFLKTFLIPLILSAFALAQTAPSKSANPSKPAPSSATSQHGKNQNDAAAKSSGSHNNMSGNHKDVMGAAADKNQGSSTHSGNMVGNHKDVMEGTAPAPSTGGKTQPATAPATSPAAQPTPAPSRPKK